jgi:hypothetical protein
MYQIKHDLIVNLNYFQVAGVYYLTHRDACPVYTYIGAQVLVYEEFRCIWWCPITCLPKQGTTAMITDGVTVGSGKLAQGPCMTSEFVEPE